MTPRIVRDVPVSRGVAHKSLRPIGGSEPVEACSDVLLQSDDRIAFAMLWECSPGAFHWDYSLDEHAFILQGRATLREGGETRELQAGDIVAFRAGSTVEWVVHEQVRKVAWLRQTGLRAVARKVKYWIKSLLAATPGLSFAPLLVEGMDRSERWLLAALGGQFVYAVAMVFAVALTR